MDKNYISHIAESKTHYHKTSAKMPYEEKIKVIVKLQQIELEMMKKNKTRKNSNRFRKVWQIY
ncbi:MAG: hypothetical protein WC879_18520 [Melioribacteraceae bacterium]